MSKRVDFSLGMSGISSGAEMGDVYDKPKPTVPNASAAAARRSAEMEEEEGAALGSSTSRDSAGTAGSRSRRFFSRKGRPAQGVGEGGVADLEAGPLVGGGVVELKEMSREHLPGIPEVMAPGPGPSRLGAAEGEVQRERTNEGFATVRTRTGPLGHQAGVDEEEVSKGGFAGLSVTAEEVKEGKSKEGKTS